MIKKINEIAATVNSFLPKNKSEVEVFRIKYLGKNGVLNQLFEEFKNVPVEEKKNSTPLGSSSQQEELGEK